MPSSMSSVLVTGATGFLGSYIVDSYVQRGILVKAMTRSTSDLTCLQPHLDAGKVTRIEASMTNADSLYRAVDGVSHIVHAAAVIGPRLANEVYQQVNVEGTRILLEAAVNAKVQRFTLISSVSTYGDGIMRGDPVTEETPQRPSNPYGKSKLAQQELTFAAYRDHGLPVVSIEPPVIYGPRARVGIGRAVGLVKRRLAPLLDFGRGHMNMVYPTDITSLLEAADATDAAVGERFLAPGPRFVPHPEIFQLIARRLNVRPLYVPVPLWATVLALLANNTVLRLRGKDVFYKPTFFYDFTKGADYRPDKAHQLLGWKPAVDVRTGIPKTVDWFLEHNLV